MAINLINQKLIDPPTVQEAIDRYMLRSNDYNIIERFETSEFMPTFHAATNTIVVFEKKNQPNIFFKIKDLIPGYSLPDVLNSFEKKQMYNNHVFRIQTSTQCELAVYYMAAIKYFPASHIGLLIGWKRSLKDESALNRHLIWDLLWQKHLKFYFAYPPSLFLVMNRYKGPIPKFLQQVIQFINLNLPANALDYIFSQIICKDWKIKYSFTPLFIDLWHQVMMESAIVYLPKNDCNDKNPARSSLRFQNSQTLFMCNSDKFLCLLLILFNKPYRSQLNTILKHEPMTPIIADIFTTYPLLHKNEC